MATSRSGLKYLPLTLLTVSILGVVGDVLAIDAANIARPASYIFRKQGDTTAENGGNSKPRQEPAEGAAAIFAPGSTAPPASVPPTAPKKAAVQPGKVEMSSSGKPFVPVAPHSKCTVSSASGADLEAQLLACAGLPAAGRNATTGTTGKAAAQGQKPSTTPRH
jgi:hypothetical protein